MPRLIKLEGKKLARPVLAVMLIGSVAACILCRTLYLEYTLYFLLDAWEIGMECFALLFPLLVTVPVCWQLYYERRDRFLVYTLPRVPKRRYLLAKWTACALSAFIILFVPYLFSALCVLVPGVERELFPPYEGYHHVLHHLYTQVPLAYALVMSLWKSVLGVLMMSFGFVLALYCKNLFVILTAPFIYYILDNVFWTSLRIPGALAFAYESTMLSSSFITPWAFLQGPFQLCVFTGLTALFYTKVMKRTAYPL